jgi:hypothetical protein
MRNKFNLGFSKECFLCRAIFTVLLLLLVGAPDSVVAQSPVGFTFSQLAGATVTNPTSLQFGPDNRLYVSQQNGDIKVFTIERVGTNNYQVLSTETILLVKNIPNHNDDGTPNASVTNRQITGLLVAGTTSNPIVYVSSSDPRIGGGASSSDKNLDTNSGIISRLTWNGSSWSKTDLVIGLPRSEENHSVNGLQLDEQSNILYLATGGNTNAGAPSNNFSFLCEYALSSSILSVDLSRIESEFGGSYTLPTLDDPTRPNSGPAGSDLNDPFGGNDGLNQAKLVTNGPVQVYSPGYRNPYDLVITKSPGKEGRLYSVDNGANKGWGGHPDQEGAFGDPLTTNVTNNYVPGEPGSTDPGPNDAVVNNKDGLHLVSKPGMDPIYGGHPNPIRANPAGAGWYWYDNATSTAHYEPSPTIDWPPVPLSMADPVEGDFRNPGVDDGSLYTWNSSTNGITEYTSADFFEGAMVGDLLVASFDGNIYRIKLTQDGTAVQFVESLASGFGSIPLDVTAQGTDEIFEGTFWVANYASGSITVFEPGFDCEGVIDVTVIPVGNTLVATTTGATYQWINCADDSEMAGETDRTLVVTEPGSYAVQITKSGCTAISACVEVTEIEDSFLMRINAGGSQLVYVDELWESDQFFLTGSTYATTMSISNTEKDELYQTERFAQNLAYSIPVPIAGKYKVVLHFAEIFWTETGKRVFNVVIEGGQGTLNNYDIVQASGGPYSAITESFVIDVTDGSVSVNFAVVLDNAKISAIEVSSCVEPTLVSVTPSQTAICEGSSAVLTVNGSLGSATAWHLYTGSCGGTIVASNTTGVFEVSPTENTTYFIRAEGGCNGPSACVVSEIAVETLGPAITLSGGTLIATPAGATYQWINCEGNTPIEGETGRFFTPEENGNYAVIVSQDGCSSTSACVNFSIVGLHEELSEKISVYPNPGQSTIKVELPIQVANCLIEITDTQGRQLLSYSVANASEFELNVEGLGKGIYFIHFRSEQMNKILKLIMD